MHPFLFSLKRAYQAALRLLQRLLVKAWFTPAKFDLLCALASSRDRQSYGSELARVLGVSRVTTARMIAKLEREEMIRRRPGPRRTKIVEFTPIGYDSFVGVRRVLFDNGVVSLAISRMLDDDPASDARLATIVPHLDTIRQRLGEPATLVCTAPLARDGTFEKGLGSGTCDDLRQLFTSAIEICGRQFHSAKPRWGHLPRMETPPTDH